MTDIDTSKSATLIDELVRLRVLELRRSASSQTELILELKNVGFSTARIADLLGTTVNVVNVTWQKAKKKLASAAVSS